MKRSRGFGRGSTVGLRAWRTALTVSLVCLFGAGGCFEGGGSRSGLSPDSGVPPPPTDRKPPGRGTVAVKVTDRLGVPVAGAVIDVRTYWTDEDKGAVADADGRAQFRDVIASAVSVTARGPDSYGGVYELAVPADRSLTVDVIVQRGSGEATGGAVWTTPLAHTVSSDGQTLEFIVRFVRVEGLGEYPNSAWGTDAVRVLACNPDAGNDTAGFHPDCVSGSEGYDAAYEAAADGATLSIERVPGPRADQSASPSSTALLIDQSANVISSDPADERLFAAKVFLSDANAQELVALAAFAAADAPQGQLALLPEVPVTLFPPEGSRFTASGPTYFATVDRLATLEGGSAPLLRALDGTLDLFAGAGGATAGAAIIVIAAGHDTTCGSRSACRSLRDAVLEKSRAMGVRIYAIGLTDPAGDFDHETLATLAHDSQGAVFVARDPRQLTSILDTVRALQRGRATTFDGTFRIQSPVAGAFSPGRTVLGHVQLEVCPWDCIYTDVPFVVRLE